MQATFQDMNEPRYPKNRSTFEQLIPFAQKIISLCNDNQIYPVLYGSFAIFYHTNNKAMEVNDIDVLIPKKSFTQAVEILEKESLDFQYIEVYPDNGMSTITVRNNNLQVELDEVGTDYSTINEENILETASLINFYGMTARIVTLDQIVDMYRTAYNRSSIDRAKILTRLELLES